MPDYKYPIAAGGGGIIRDASIGDLREIKAVGSTCSSARKYTPGAIVCRCPSTSGNAILRSVSEAISKGRTAFIA